MKICPLIQVADAKEMRRQGELAFTMVEIAIAIGVIGFALVAIIGILPTGMNAQKDNREDTVISQDAPFFLDAIRNGAPFYNAGASGNFVAAPAVQGLDFLTNYVQSIRFDYLLNGKTNTSYTYTSSNYQSGAAILGLLSTPQTNYFSPYFASNYFITTATVRALSGPATEQNGLNSVMAFTYRMEVEITPFNNIAPDSTNYMGYADPTESLIRSNRWLEFNTGIQYTAPSYVAGGPPLQGTFLPPVLVNGILEYPGVNYPIPSYLPVTQGGTLNYGLFDVRLRFSWPVLQNGGVGPGRQTYRTVVHSQMVYAVTNNIGGWFFQPQNFTNSYPANL